MSVDAKQINKDKKKNNVRRKISHAALEFLSENRVEDLSMRAIAKYMGVSTMMPYHYFSTKGELLTEIRKTMFENLAVYLNKCADANGEDEADRFISICLGYFKYVDEAPADFTFMFERGEEIESPELVSGDLGWKLFLDVVRALLERKNDQIYNEALLIYKTHYVWCVLHGLASLHLSKMLGFNMSFNSLTKPIVESALREITNVKTFKTEHIILPSVKPLICSNQ